MHLHLEKKFIAGIAFVLLAALAVGLSPLSVFAESEESLPQTSFFEREAEDTAHTVEALTPYLEIKKLFDRSEDETDDNTVQCYARWLSDTYSGSVTTQGEWLAILLDRMEYLDAGEATPEEAFLLSQSLGITYGWDDLDAYSALSRAFFSYTLSNALGYKTQSVPCADADTLSGAERYVMTALYFGYLETDADNQANPSALLSKEEVRAAADEVETYMKLKGKRILSFGDSIMYGEGNGGVGIADLIAQKYAMTAADYAVSGATFAYFEGRSHIPAQIEKAIKAKEKADVILINGGTNDMVRTQLGSVSTGFNIKKIGYKTYANGLEYSFGLLRQSFGGTPVVYIRAHNMDITDGTLEEKYGKMALNLAIKWEVETVDIYSDTDFNSEIPEICDRYTMYSASKGKHDSIHPTHEGYVKFYLPLTVSKIADLLEK